MDRFKADRFLPKRAILFVNREKDNAQTLSDEIRLELERRDIHVRTLTYEGKPDFGAEPGYDLAFSLGGDGTVLWAARSMAPFGVPVFPINLGTLGFIAAVHPEDWVKVFNLLLEGKVRFSRRLMLEAMLERKGKEITRQRCLNDMVISFSGIAKIIRLRIYAGHSGDPEEPAGEPKYMSLGQYRSDGLILATPTGSTAYSMAAGGPIVDPEMEAMILNPICPFTLSYRPMVFPAHETLIVEVEHKQRSGVLLTVDGQITEPLEPGDRVYVSRSQWPGILIASDRSIFYHALKTKMSWLDTPKTGGSYA